MYNYETSSSCEKLCTQSENRPCSYRFSPIIVAVSINTPVFFSSILILLLGCSPPLILLDLCVLCISLVHSIKHTPSRIFLYSECVLNWYTYNNGTVSASIIRIISRKKESLAFTATYRRRSAFIFYTFNVDL